MLESKGYKVVQATNCSSVPILKDWMSGGKKLTFVLVRSIETVLSAIAPPEHRDALTAVSTLPLVVPALGWWYLTALIQMRNIQGK